MGEKVRGHAHAFDGRTLDWHAVLGSSFAAAPKEHISVFREASREELHRIAREGIAVPLPEFRHPEMRAEMELLDKHRPEHILKRGISRLNAIFAVPTPETPRQAFRKEFFVLEIKVDPEESFVGDMDFITSLIPFIGVSRRGLEKYAGALSKYWDSVIPLSDFKKHYKRVETGDGDHWLAKADAPKNFPQTYFAPEVLVMSPVISQRHMRVVSHGLPSADAPEEDDDVPYEGY